MAQIINESFRESFRTPLKISVNDEPPGDIDTFSPRLPRTRRRQTPYGQPNHFYSVHDYYLTAPPYSLYKHERQDEPDRLNDVEYVQDTIRNTNYDIDKYGKIVDDGGSFLSYKIGFWKDRVHNYDFRNPSNHHYYGCAYCIARDILHDGFRPAIAMSPPLMDLSSTPHGATLWNRMKPAKPTLSTGIFIGELRDLPRLLYARLEGIRTISDFFLAVQFGWRPLIQDIMNMLNFYERISAQIDFILNNIGKPLHREAVITVPDRSGTIYQSSGTTECWIDPTNGYKYFGGSPNYSKYKNKFSFTLKQRVRGTGMFVFYFDRGRIPDRIELAGKLSGLQLTPALVWELLPWSFLIDYFSNVGDILNNLVTEVADSQVSLYCYSQMETNRDYKWESTDGYHTVSVSRYFDTKVRDKVSPFGLATFSTALTNMQLTILAALGISRF